MKKKILSVLLATAMVFSLAGCGSTASNTSKDATVEAETTGDTATDTATEAGTVDNAAIKIGMVTDTGGVNDGSFNQSSWEGLTRATKELGITTKYLESATDADYVPNIETFVDEEYDLIICVGYALADALRSEAVANPEQKFAIIDDAMCSNLDNVTCLLFEQAQASYLVGYVAGLTTETNVVGIVIGMSTDTMNEFGYGYCAGVMDANPDAKVLQSNANSFADTAAGKTAANSMIADKADIVFHAAGGTGLGVIDACKEAGIWAIGVDSDQSVLAPKTILTSAMKRVDNACYDVAEAVLNGTLEQGVKTYSLADAGVDIAPKTDNLDPDVLTKVNEVKEKIISGEMKVPSTKADFEAAYGDKYELD